MIPYRSNAPVGIFYATREGHTLKVAEHIADEVRALGLRARVHNVRGLSPRIGLNNCSAAILAASVHAGRHEAEMVNFVKEHRAELEHIPTAFLSVTLSEAGAERADVTPEARARFTADVEKMIDQFFEETQWHPKRVKPVAGALLYTKYNILVRFIMKRIAKKAGAATDTSHDHVYTDWATLSGFVEEFVHEIKQAAVFRSEAMA